MKLLVRNYKKRTSTKLPWIPIEFKHNFFQLSAFTNHSIKINFVVLDQTTANLDLSADRLWKRSITFNAPFVNY